MDKKSIDDILNIFFIRLYILKILQKEPMTVSQIEEKIYADKYAFYKANNENILKAFSKLMDEKYIELLEDQNLFKITEYGIDEYWKILDRIANDNY